MVFPSCHPSKGNFLLCCWMIGVQQSLRGKPVSCYISGRKLTMEIYRVIRLGCQKSKTLYTRNYANLLLVNGKYMCRRVWSLCLSTLALNMSTIAHAAQIKPRFLIAPRGTQHFWSDLLKGRCNLPP